MLTTAACTLSVETGHTLSYITSGDIPVIVAIISTNALTIIIFTEQRG